MLNYLPILLTFVVLINSFAIGKIVKKNYFSLSSSLAFFAGLIIYCVIYSTVYIPFILISYINQYYLYTTLVIQAILFIYYCINWKSFSISFVFNYKVVLSFVISLIILFFCYYLFFVKTDFSQINFVTEVFDFLVPMKFEGFSIINNQLLDLFTNANVTTNDFLLFQNVLIPIILMLIASSVLIEFYWIRNFKSIKDFITLSFASFLLGFFVFNIYKTNTQIDAWNESLLNDSFAIIIFFFAVNVFVKNNLNQENHVYFFILNYSFLFLIFLSSNFIVITLIVFLMAVIYVSFKQINFGADLIIQNSIFMIAAICLFTLSKYYLKDTASIIVFSLLLAASIILFSIYYIQKRNNYKTTYWPFMQKATFRINKYFKLCYFIIFFLILIAVLVSCLSKLFGQGGYNSFIQDINVFNFLSNVINYNASAKTIDFTNSIFLAFYIIMLLISFIYVWRKRKEASDFNNLLLFSLSFLLLFSPLVVYGIKNLSYILSMSDSVINYTYDFALFCKLILIFPFIYITYLFKNMQFVKFDFKFMEKVNLISNNKQLSGNKYLNLIFLNARKPIYIASNIFVQLVQNDYFKFGLYACLMSFFTISVFVCNFV